VIDVDFGVDDRGWIFTARISEPDPAAQGRFITAMHRWCDDNNLRRLHITNVKDFAMDELYDDRAVAVAVEPNTGRLLTSSRRGLAEADDIRAENERLRSALEKSAETFESAATAFRLFDKQLAAEAMTIAMCAAHDALEGSDA
jgi:hypothetical protein